MSAKVQGWVWDLADLLPQRRLVLLWLANRATDNGVCFPGQAEVRRKTGLGEKMVRRHLHWLASDVDDDGNPKAPLMTIVERRIDADRNTSNVYVLHVPWAQADVVARELEELKHVPAEVVMSMQGRGSPATGKNPVTGTATGIPILPLIPLTPATSSSGRGMLMLRHRPVLPCRNPRLPQDCWSPRSTAVWTQIIALRQPRSNGVTCRSPDNLWKQVLRPRRPRPTRARRRSSRAASRPSISGASNGSD